MQNDACHRPAAVSWGRCWFDATCFTKVQMWCYHTCVSHPNHHRCCSSRIAVVTVWMVFVGTDNTNICFSGRRLVWLQNMWPVHRVSNCFCFSLLYAAVNCGHGFPKSSWAHVALFIMYDGFSCGAVRRLKGQARSTAVSVLGLWTLRFSQSPWFFSHYYPLKMVKELKSCLT